MDSGTLAAGVEQGDPLSPILFNLANEPIVTALQHTAPDHGYPLCSRHYSVVAYADDLVLLAEGELQQAAGHCRFGWHYM